MVISLDQVDNNEANRAGKIALVGHPNVGKSVLFNQLTGASQRIANFPGITLSYLEGTIKTSSAHQVEYELVDLPGFYSFSSSKREELVSQHFVMENDIKLLVNVADARKLEKNLALTLQLMETRLPMILVLTYWDKIKDKFNLAKLQNHLGLPIIAVNSHDSKDMERLKMTIHENVRNTSDLDIQPPHLLRSSDRIDMIQSHLSIPEYLFQSKTWANNRRWITVHTLLAGTQLSAVPAMISAQIDGIIKHNIDVSERTLKLELLRDYYEQAESIVQDIIGSSGRGSTSRRLDKILLHPLLGLIIFVGTMTLMFVTTFTMTDPINAWMELQLEHLSLWISTSVQSDLLASFLTDGIIGGVGFVLVFIPQITMLFLFIGLMEQSGYMARVVYLTDQYLDRLGISGTSVAPLLLGFGCNVPGIMATRSIAEENERLTIGLVNPYISCSARLPVYVVIASAIFPQSSGLIVSALYFIGIVVAVLIMFLLRKTILKGESQFLLMELPSIEKPNLKSVVLYGFRHVKKFVRTAATWMSLGIIGLWVLSITGPGGYIGPAGLSDQVAMQGNWISFLGNLLAPVFAPMGWDNRLIMALILGFIAKEIVVGSLGLLYGVQSAGVSSVLVTQFTPVTGFAFMVFVLLYTPCIGTYMTMRHELGKKWANFSILLSLVLAYMLSLLIVLIG